MSAPTARQTRALVDGALDGTLDAPSRDRLTELLRADPALLASFDDERHTLAALKDVPQGRDLTGNILESVARRRAFLSRSARLRVWGGRGALAASLLLAIGAIAVIQRVYPRAAVWSGGPGPVSAVESTVRANAASGLETMTQAASGLQKKAFGSLTDRPELTLGESAAYERRTYVVSGDIPSSSGALSAREFRAWKLGVPQGDEGFVISRVHWTDRSDPRRAFRTNWDAGAAMQLNDEASAIERSWLLRFWMNSQPVPGIDSTPER